MQDRMCPICSQPLYAGQHVYFDDGEIIHLRCWLMSPNSAAAVAAFLVRNTGRRYCHLCIAATLDLPYGDVSKAVTRLRLDERYRAEPATCVSCGKTRVTIGVDLSGAGSEAGTE